MGKESLAFAARARLETKAIELEANPNPNPNPTPNPNPNPNPNPSPNQVPLVLRAPWLPQVSKCGKLGRSTCMRHSKCAGM